MSDQTAIFRLMWDERAESPARSIRAPQERKIPDRRRRFGWQAGYGIFTVSQSQVEKVRRYIRNQEEHHRRVSFKEELIELLRRNGIPFDEKYLLG